MYGLEKLNVSDEVTMVDRKTNEEYTGIVSWLVCDIVSLANVKGFKGKAIFTLDNFMLKA